MKSTVLMKDVFQTIAPPEPGLTPEEMIRRAESMRHDLRSAQAAAEASGNISPEMNQAMVDAGFFRVIQPGIFGGYGFDLPTYVRLVTAVARGCPETAWVLSLVLGHVHQLSTYPAQAQREAYGVTGDFRAPEVAAPQGHGVEVPGGYRVSGAWDYASGCAHATHIFLTFTLVDAESGTPQMRMGLFNRDDYSIVRNWDVIGMQGTGSDRVVMEDVFVPAHRTKAYPPINAVLPAGLYDDSPLFHGPARPFIVTESASVIVGAAEGALDLYEESIRTRKATGPTGAARQELAEYQFNYGRCRALVDTARAALLQTASDYMQIARKTCATGEACPDDEMRRLTLVILQSIHLAHEAVDIIFRTAGTSASRKDSMLGRYWRNVGVLRGHLAHQSDSAAVNYGRAHFGQPTVGIA
ncbi:MULTISPECIES: acyl-CoA dehydrogenase family protein [Burkholderia cepacia complex]|uniref:acyl-CoA dehydrogenase family protein n=1 Tax=Burkholderia cepacia complex TaxID=87882 RepID=UPI0007544FDB|nr:MULTISPECIES: acyl-CoA dehydrogenase family protein [Burkholderia cepacia complex]KWH62949.1 oxidoreductase [Burkholderia anthina]KWH62954.1 oxidoreductase [Burkholderia anthina]MDN7681567.1 acyl-CoA dehydrogenase family protein [Burkholderia cenocepacia]MDN7681572.1 acyl-CoA dehydrogenase family protein [Burkholderia cenocepacia]